MAESFENQFNNLNQIIDMTQGQTSYINLVRVTTTPNEVILDLQFIAPDTNFPQNPTIRHLHRVAMPLAVAKELGNLLENSINKWEEASGVNLPFMQANQRFDAE